MVKLVLPSAVIPKSPADLPPPGPSGEKPTEISVKPDRKKLRRLVVLGFSVLIFVVVVIIIWYLQLHGYVGVKSKEAISNSTSSQASSAQLVDFPNVTASFDTSSKLDKGRIVFIRDHNVWSIDQGGQKKLTHFDTAKEAAELPLLSQDNSKILYVDNVLNGTAHAKLIDYAGSNDLVLTDIAAAPLDWSSDGTSVMTQSPNNSGQLTVRLVDLKGREIRKTSTSLISQGCGGAGGTPAGGIIMNALTGYGIRQADSWLDGNHYLVGLGNCDTAPLAIINDTGKVVKLPDDMINPKASIDFTQFVGVNGDWTNLKSTNGSVYYFQADGTLIKKIDVPITPLDAVLSVDKKFIFFTSVSNANINDPSAQLTSSLWRVNVDGSGLTKVFDEIGAIRIIPEMFSGDGNLLIYERVSDNSALVKDVANGVKDQIQLAKDAPRSDIYIWNSTTGDKTKVVENGYQATYSSK